MRVRDLAGAVLYRPASGMRNRLRSSSDFVKTNVAGWSWGRRCHARGPRRPAASPTPRMPGFRRRWRSGALSDARDPFSGNVGFTSMSARMSSVAGNFAAVDRKLIDPLSPATDALIDVPSSCSAFDSASRVAGLRAFAEQRRRQRRHALLAGRLELIGAAEKRDGERDQRQVVLLGHHAVRRRWPAWSSSRPAPAAPAFSRRPAPSCDRAPAAPTAPRDSSRTTANAIQPRSSSFPTFRFLRVVVGHALCSGPAWPPDRACPRGRRSARRGRW